MPYDYVTGEYYYDGTEGDDTDSGYQLPGNYVTADVPTDAPNLEGGDLGAVSGQRIDMGDGSYKTFNSDGSVTYQDPDGQTYTVKPDGTYTGQAEGSQWTYDPKTASFGGGLGSLMNSVKGYFQKKDAQGNPIPGEYDWAKIAGAGVAAAGALGIGSQKTSGGWQGSIPKYTASREQIKYNDPNRRPGSVGRQYFTDVNYSGAPTAPQAQGILAAYKAAEAPAASKWNAQNAVATPWAKRPEAARLPPQKWCRPQQAA